MFKKVLLILFFLLILLCPYVMAQLGGNDAYVIYTAFFKDKRDGIYEKEGFVFLIAEVEITSKRVKRSHWEGKAMLRVNELLKQYCSRGVQLPGAEDIPYEGELRKAISELISSGNYLNINISGIRGRILENLYRDNVYRYVFAAPVEQFEKYKKNISVSISDTDFIVKRAFEQAKEDELYNELKTFYLELGLVEDALYYQRQFLSESYPMINYYHAQNPFAERKVLREILLSEDAIKEADAEMLKRLPASFEIIDHIITSGYNEDSPAAIIFYLTALPDSSEEEYERTFKNILKRIEALHRHYKKIKEYSVLIQDLNKNADKSFFQQNDVLKYAFMTFGHLEFDSSIRDDPNKYFIEAKAFFQKGKNIEKITKLLVKSVAISPRHADGWNYLGAVLTAENKTKEALIVHTQAYQIDNTDIETMANIADCYYRLNYNELAGNYAEHLALLNKDIQNTFVNKIINKIKIIKKMRFP